LLSSGRLSGVKASHPRRGLKPPEKENPEPFAAAKSSYWKSWGAMTLAPAEVDAGFKKCCLKGGKFDGVLRHEYLR